MHQTSPVLKKKNPNSTRIEILENVKLNNDSGALLIFETLARRSEMYKLCFSGGTQLGRMVTYHSGPLGET